ncbi:PASTA domain-containing protein [Erysipelothrix sp. D19-032]
MIVYTSYVAKYGHDVDYSAVHVNKIVKAAVNAMNVSQANGNSVIEAVKPTKIRKLYEYQCSDRERKVLNHTDSHRFGLGNGSHVIKQFPLPETNMIANERVILYTGGSEIVMPDMTGWSHKEVTSFMSMTGYVISIEGSGYVASQSVAAGTVLSADTTISVKLS